MDLQNEFNKVNTKLDKIMGYTAPSAYVEECLLLTYGEWLGEWLRLFKVGKVKEGTLYNYERYVKQLPQKLKDNLLSKISPLDLQRYLISVTAPRQKEHMYGLLKDSFTRAFVLQMIEYNPMLAIDPPRHIKREAKSFDNEEEKRFVTACKCSKYCDMFMIMLYCGLRKGEAMALNTRDIDIKRRIISVTKTVNELNHIGTPKSRAGVRQVPILDNLLPCVQKYVFMPKGRIFNINEANVHKKFVEVLQKANLDGKGFTTHTLRHTYVTRCCENEIPLKVAQKWAGHSNASITMNVYAHCNKDYEQKAIAMYNEKLKVDTLSK